MEYTHLLTSQLDSQRLYFEEKTERAADKASRPPPRPRKLRRPLYRPHNSCPTTGRTQPRQRCRTSLERDKARAEREIGRLTRKLEKEWREEKAMNGSLMERIEYMNKELQQIKEANVDLSEQIRDLTFFISSQEKLKDHSEDVREGLLAFLIRLCRRRRREGQEVVALMARIFDFTNLILLGSNGVVLLRHRASIVGVGKWIYPSGWMGTRDEHEDLDVIRELETGRLCLFIRVMNPPYA
jgi:hypothetical protein